MKKTTLLLFIVFFISACSTAGTVQKDVMLQVSDGIVQSEMSGLMWQQNESKLFSSAEEAQKYADDLTLGGYTDWRIPTKSESHNLYFSLDFGETMAKDLNMKMDRALWVQSPDGELLPGIWDSGEGCCIIRSFIKERRARVRAVRP